MASTQPTTSALLSLLPSYNHTTLPPRLITTASSLLAQSRQRASNLKPEEEIARAYACAEIAVNRLREPLRLPPKKTGGRASSATAGGPPCKPAVYRKLFTFLEQILERDAVTPQSTTKRKRDIVAGQAANDETEDVDPTDQDTPTATPSKRACVSTTTPTSSRTPASTTSSYIRKRSNGDTTTSFAGRLSLVSATSSTTHTEAPASIMPTIRKFCKHYSTPSMAPHVYTGVCIVLRLAQLWPPPPSSSSSSNNASSEHPDFETDITALTVALYLMVLTKMQRGQLKTKTFNAVRGTAVEIFGRAKGLTDPNMISDWIRKINSQGWCKGQEWWASVPDGVIDGVENDARKGDDDDHHHHSNGHAEFEGDDLTDSNREDSNDNNYDDDDDDDDLDLHRNLRSIHLDLSKPDPEDVLLPGLGTMMQESLDWNSDEKTRSFETWKKGILKTLAQLQRGSSGGHESANKGSKPGRSRTTGGSGGGSGSGGGGGVVGVGSGRGGGGGRRTLAAAVSAVH